MLLRVRSLRVASLAWVVAGCASSSAPAASSPAAANGATTTPTASSVFPAVPAFVTAEPPPAPPAPPAAAAPPPTYSKAPAAPGEPTPPGSVPQPPTPSADSVVAKNRWRFKACYDKALAEDPAANGGAEGLPKFTLKFDAAGKVESVKTVCSPLPKPLTECLRKAHLTIAAESGGTPNGTYSVGGPC